jgi:hypothetical protein
MNLRKLLLAMMVAGMLSSVALAGGPWGAPMSLLDHGQWAVDVAYTQEEMDLYGCGDWSELFRLWEGADWGDWSSDGGIDRLRVVDFETSGIMGSLEYGLCDNWDVYVRLGMVDAEGSILERGVDEGVPWEWKQSLDFSYGFAWQVGSAFTICQHGPWTWGGRMQFGMANPDDDSFAVTDVEVEEGVGEFVDAEQYDVELDFWQAYAYLGPTYQLNDAWLIYCGGGWQTLHANVEIDCRGSAEFTPDGGDPEPLAQWQCDDSYILKHASAIGVFGAAWCPSPAARVGVDVLLGEGGKWGWAVAGVFPF